MDLMCILALGRDMFFEDEESDEERRVLEKVENYVELMVSNFQDNQFNTVHWFRQNFRMSPGIFEDLLRKLHIINMVQKGQPQLNHEKQIMICVWYLANMESLRSVSERFGVSKSSGWNVVKRVCLKIIDMNRDHQVLVWPSRQRALNIINAFQRINGFPGVLGCIDGTHIKILPPVNNPNSYYIRKKFHSILLQAVCDNRKLFLDVYAGEPGSIHDSRLFQKSDLSQRINNNNLEFPNNSHLLSDLACPLSKNLLVGFKDNGNLTNRQRNYNQKLSQIRVTIEHAFALLKGRFRRLKFIENIRLHMICLITVASCFLHNICILQGDSFDDIFDFEAEVQEIRNLVNPTEENPPEENPPVNYVQINRREAINKRNNIVQILP